MAVDHHAETIGGIPFRQDGIDRLPGCGDLALPVDQAPHRAGGVEHEDGVGPLSLRLRAVRRQQGQAKRQQAGDERTTKNLDHGSVLDDANNPEQGRLRRHGGSKHPVRTSAVPLFRIFVWAAGLPFRHASSRRLKGVQIAQLTSGHLDYGDTGLA